VTVNVWGVDGGTVAGQVQPALATIGAKVMPGGAMSDTVITLLPTVNGAPLFVIISVKE